VPGRSQKIFTFRGCCIRLAIMKVALFIPCYVEHLGPEVGLATATILNRLGLNWSWPHKQTCCGQPTYNAGHPAATVPAARHFAKIFAGFDRVVSPSGSCVAMVRRYHQLPGLKESERAPLFDMGQNCHELCQFLVDILGVTDLQARFNGRAVYQDCCHTLRELKIRNQSRQLLASIEGLDLIDQPQAECCGFGGIYSVKVPEMSVAQADQRLELIQNSGADTLIATDFSCLMHLQARADFLGRPLRTLHIAQVLAGEAVSSSTASTPENTVTGFPGKTSPGNTTPTGNKQADKS
jgi:L-lactate dehydrogenase complex protein LldE